MATHADRRSSGALTVSRLLAQAVRGVVPPYAGSRGIEPLEPRMLLTGEVSADAIRGTGVVGDLVWNDLNADGVQDVGESGVDGVTVRLYNQNGLYRTTTTANGGIYRFTELPDDDTYFIEAIAPAGFRWTLQDAGGHDRADSDVNPETGRTTVFTLADGQVDLSKDAGLVGIPGGSILGSAFEDRNADGIRQSSEVGLSGWKAFIDANGDGQWQGDEPSVAIGLGGGFKFADLTPGVYTLSVVAPSGWTATLPLSQTVRVNSQQVVGGVGFGFRTVPTSSPAMPIGPEIHVNTYTASDQTYPSVAMDAAGNFVAVWESVGQDGSGEGVFGRRFNAAGQPIGSEFQISATGQGRQVAPVVAMDADGDFVAVWQNQTDRLLYAQRFNAAGQKVGGEFLVSTLQPNGRIPYSVAMDADGDFAVVWQTSAPSDVGEIVVQRFNAAGEPQGEILHVNTYVNATQSYPNVGMNAQGDFVVTWLSAGQDGYGYGVYAQQYNRAGEKVGAEFGVTTYTQRDQNFNDVAVADDGSFVIAWQSHDSAMGHEGICAQRYDAAGKRVGFEFRVGGNPMQWEPRAPSVAIGRDGGFLIAWQEPGRGVLAQSFSAAGAVLGPVVQVNASASTMQLMPTVAGTRDGRFAVVWQNANQGNDGGLGIFARRLGPAEPLSVSGLVWLDKDGDGIREPGEQPLDAVVVHLLAYPGTELAYTVTENGGRYRFDNLQPGQRYIVQFDTSTGLMYTYQDRGTDDTVDSDGDAQLGRTKDFLAAPGLIYDMGLVETSFIEGYVFHDINGDGQWNGDDRGLEASIVYLDQNGNGELDNREQYVETFADGRYIIRNVLPGTYRVACLVGANWVQTTPVEGSYLITVEPGHVFGGHLFGVRSGQTATVGGWFFYDANDDGIRNEEESGMFGSVALLDMAGNVVRSVETAGQYEFADLPPGQYKLKFYPTTGVLWSRRDQGADDMLDSDVDEVSGETPVMTLTAGQVDLSWSGGALYWSGIQGRVFHDLNANGQLDENEPGLDGRTIYLDTNANGELDEGEPSKVTADGGYWWFGPLRLGAYRVAQAPVAGWSVTSPGEGWQDVVVRNGTNEYVGFGNRQVPATGVVGGWFFYDANDNGIREEDEAPMEGFVELQNATGSVLRRTQAEGGRYAFEEVPAGQYVLKFYPLTGVLWSKQDQGGDEMLDSDVDMQTGRTALFTFAAGQVDMSWSAGVMVPSGITGTAYNDMNGNGLRDPDEPVLEGRTVYLDTNANGQLDGEEPWRLTDSYGFYYFGPVRPGVYRVAQVPVAGWAVTTPASGWQEIQVRPGWNEYVDFASRPVPTTALIGGWFFWDQNNNDVLDEEDAGSGGSYIELLDSVGRVVDRVQANLDGSYLLEDVPAGQYRLKFYPSTGVVWCRPNQGDDERWDSDVDTRGLTPLFTVAPGQNDRNWSAGVILPGGVMTVAFNDLNGNGVREGFEPRLAGGTFYLDANANGQLDEGELSAVSDEWGIAYLGMLRPGEYRVAQVAMPGWTVTTPVEGWQTVTVQRGAWAETLPFGSQQAPDKPGSISGWFFDDRDGNGVRDDNEGGFGWTYVRLLTPDGRVVQTVRTDDSGWYAMEDVPSGQTLMLEFVPVTAMLFTFQDCGGNDAVDSDVNVDTGRTPEFVLSSGQQAQYWAGVMPPAGFYGTVYHDANGNGRRDETETGLAGRTMYIDANANGRLDGDEVSTTSVSDGKYYFGMLRPGVYRVAQVKQDGWVATSPAEGWKSVDIPLGTWVEDIDFGSRPRMDPASLFPQGPEFRVDAAPGFLYSSSVAMSASGRYVVSWTYRSPANEDNVFARVYLADGTPLGQPFQVNTTTGRMDEAPSVAMDAFGNFVVVWMKFLDGQVYARRYNAAGLPLTGEFPVTTPNLWGANPSVALEADGDFIAVWRGGVTNNNEHGVYGQRFNANNQRVGSVFYANSTTQDFQQQPTVAVDADGDFVVAWEGSNTDYGSYAVYARRYSSAGHPLGWEFPVSRVSASSQEHPDVAMMPDGGFLLVWYDGENHGVYARRYNTEGEALNGGVRIGDGYDPAVVIDDAGAVVTWRYSDGIYARSLDTAGMPQGEAVRVDMLTSFQLTPGVGSDGHGNYVLAWCRLGGMEHPEQNGVFARRYTRQVQPTSTVGGRVWEDRNANGIQDAGEVGRPDTYVALFAADGTHIKTIQTDAEGRYQFTGLVAGVAYKIRFYAPTSVRLTQQDQGADDRLDSDAAPDTGDTAVFVFSPWESAAFDAGMFVMPGVSGTVYDDRNGNGVRDYNEPGLVEWTVYIDKNRNGVLDSGDVASLTDSDGRYLLNAGWPGLHRIALAPREGWTQTMPVGGAYLVNLVSGDWSNGKDFGARSNTAGYAAVGGVVWLDDNSDGIRDDDNEHGLAGAAVSLYTASGEWVATTETGEDGWYFFENLRPGQYVLEVPRLSGLAHSPLNQGSDDTRDSDINPATSRTAVFTLQPGQIDHTQDSGQRHYLSITGFKFNDLNGNGRFEREGGEVGLPGWTLYLDLNANGQRDAVEPTSTTGEDGRYGFYDLFVGTYRVAEVPQAGWITTVPGQGWYLVPGPQDETSFGSYQATAPRPQPRGPEMKIPFPGGHSYDPAIAMDADGDFVVVWQVLFPPDHDTCGIHFQLFGANGTPRQTYPTMLSPMRDEAMRPTVAMDPDGDFVIAWQQFNYDSNDYDLYFQRFNAAGNALGEEQRVQPVIANQSQTNPAIAMDNAGNFVLVWEGGEDDADSQIYAQRFSMEGDPLGAGFLVEATAMPHVNPAVAMDADGDFVVAWQMQLYPQLPGQGVFAQRFNAAGVPQGERIDFHRGVSHNPAVAMDDVGNFVIAWQENPTSTDSNILATRFAADGSWLGLLPLAMSPTVDETSPTLVMNGRGECVVLWETDDGQGKHDIFGQALTPAGTYLGPTFQVNVAGGERDSRPAIAIADNGLFAAAWETDDVSNVTFGGDKNDTIFVQRYTLSAATSAEGTPGNDKFLIIRDGERVAVYLNDAASPTWLFPLTAERILINGNGGDDTFIIDYAKGNPSSATGMLRINGGPQGAATNSGDQLIFRGIDTMSAAYKPTGGAFGAGAIIVDGGEVVFADVENVTIARSQNFVLITPFSDDKIAINVVGNIANRVSGSSGGVPFTPVLLQNTRYVMLDTGANDRGAGHDSITLPAGMGGDTLLGIKPGTGVNIVTVQGGHVGFMGIAGVLDSVPPFPNWDYTLTVTGSAKVDLPTSTGISVLTIHDSACVDVRPSVSKVLRLKRLEIHDSGLLNLNGCELVIQPGIALRETALFQIANLIRDGGRIRNTTPDAAPAGSMATAASLAGLAVVANDRGDGQLLRPDESADAILVKYTWNGDVNLDGEINLTDYFAIDSGYLNKRQGYANGDVNYDGEINLADYFLIDSAYLGQQSFSEVLLGMSAAATEAEVLVVRADPSTTSSPPRQKSTRQRAKTAAQRQAALCKRTRIHRRKAN